MSELRVPSDESAEAGVIGCCVDSDAGYLLASSRLVADDFYVGLHRRIFEACGRLGHLNDPKGLTVVEQRIVNVAALVAEPVDRVRRLVEDRPLQRDFNGTLAARVGRAAQARAAMVAARDLFNRLGEGEPLERVVADLAPDLRRLVVAS